MHDLLGAIAMSMLPGRLRFDAVRRVRAAWHDGTLRAEASADQLVGHLLTEARVPGLASGVLADARRAMVRASEAGLSAIAFTDPAYPVWLGRLEDAPAVLWVRGDVRALDATAVAIVGSRAASPGAIEAGRRLAADLAAVGVTVVSGLARGVDAAAHEGALATGLTVAVLGNGADLVYPAEHATLATRIVERGAVVSEFPAGTAPRRHHFPLRNRIISGLSLAVVVVEAAQRSGALITARTALDQGREVMAMPGAIAGGRNRGAHELIRDGALLVETAEDVLAGLRAQPAGATGTVASPPAPDDAILGQLAPGEVAELDVLVRSSGLDGPSVMARVSQLEIAGWVERVPGGRIIRLSRKW